MKTDFNFGDDVYLDGYPDRYVYIEPGLFWNPEDKKTFKYETGYVSKTKPFENLELLEALKKAREIVKTPGFAGDLTIEVKRGVGTSWALGKLSRDFLGLKEVIIHQHNRSWLDRLKGIHVELYWLDVGNSERTIELLDQMKEKGLLICNPKIISLYCDDK